jgi:iron complex transport system ATP-binding protein
MIEVDSLHFRYPGAPSPTLRGVDFRIAAGEVVALLGPNGCGKTTLLRCLAGQLSPTSGGIRLDGRPAASLSVRHRARLVATVPQDHGIPFAYSVAEVVLMGRTPHVGLLAAPGRRDHEAAAAALAQIGMEAFAGQPFNRLSGGERQLVLVARALAQETPVLLLDEPTSHLDLRNQLRVLEQVRAIVPQRRLAVLMTLHDPNLALSFADRALMLADGGIWSDGPPAEVISPAGLASVFGVEADVVEFGGRHVVLARRAR